MPSQTIHGVSLQHPGNSLAAWLAAHHPDLFLSIYKAAQSARAVQRMQMHGLRGLAQDLGTDPPLENITVDTSSIVPASFLTDATDTGSSFLDSVSNGLTSAGSTLGNTLSSMGSGLLGALGSVGSYLGSSAGLNTLAGVAKGYFSAQQASSQAQVQQAVLNTQLARISAGSTAAPITYTRDASGNVVPVYQTQTPRGPIYQPLSAQGIASLTPSGLSVLVSKYGFILALGGIAIAWAFAHNASRR